MRWVVFALALLAAVACSRPETTVVDFWHVMGGPLGKRLDELIAEFNAAHPEGRIRSVHMGSYDALAQKLMGAIASNSPPVIAQMYESWTDQFHAAGYLVPLQVFVDADTDFHLDDFYPVFVEDNTFDSILVSLPFNKSVPVFYCNQDLLRQAGVDSFPATWDEFRTACEQLKGTGAWPTSWPIDVWYFSTLLYQEGGFLYDPATRRTGFDSDIGVKVLTYLVDLVRDSLFYLNPGFQRQDEFLSGNVAIIPASIVSWAFLKGRPGFNMRVLPFPTSPRRAVVIAGTNVGMFKRTSAAQQRLAWEFVSWFLKSDIQVRWTEASYYLPTRRSVSNEPAFRRFLDENPGYDRILAQLDYAMIEPKAREWFTGRIYLNEALEEALRLERTPAQALNNAARRLLVDLP